MTIYFLNKNKKQQKYTKLNSDATCDTKQSPKFNMQFPILCNTN